MPRITDFCIYIYVFECKLSLFRLCDSDFGITSVDDITIGITCTVFCFHIKIISFAIIIIIIIDANAPSHITFFYAMEQNLIKTYLRNTISSDAKRTHDIKHRIVTAKSDIQQKTLAPANRALFKKEINEMLHLEHTFVRC